MKKSVSTSKGFTLIELLIVITIIGILAVALLPSVLGAPARARDAARKADLNNIIAAIETFNSDNQHYPGKGGCVDAVGDGSNTNVLNGYFQGGTPPKDPQGKGPANAVSCTTGYIYCPTTGITTSYYVASHVEIPGDGNIVSVAATFPTCTSAVAPPTIPAIKPAAATAYVVQK